MRQMSTNHPVVKMRAQCEGLFIPVVERAMFRNMIPVFGLKMVNNSTHRYEVKFDVTLRRHSRSMYHNNVSDWTVEKTTIVRAGTTSDILLEKVNPSSGVTIREVKQIEVLECKKT